ncbi:MAG TPA: ABC transporter substrate binding protein [Azospira sp.]|nr:ABC transporter substrate binding protein [Azospira sp.]
MSLLLAAAVSAATAAPTRVMVIYAETDEFSPGGYRGLISGMEQLSAVEVLRLALDGGRDKLVAQLLSATSRAGAPIKLAAAGGNPGPIAVLYPDIGEPYRSVFAKIIEGIEDKTRNKVASYAVGGNFNAQELSGELKRQDIQVVIALGRNGLKAASSLDKSIGVVIGGVISATETDSRGSTILSLAPDPALLFARLKALSPRTQRVTVIYDPRQNGWLIKLAQEAARAQGIELVAQEAADLKSALALYQQFLAAADVRRDALWLPQDSATVDESTVLPLVLQESWTKGLLVFSSNASHVRRGALFALYPNNVELGRNLAASALGVVAGAPAGRGTLPLRDVLTAFNTRTASHLGLNISASQQRDFDLLFPEQ